MTDKGSATERQSEQEPTLNKGRRYLRRGLLLTLILTALFGGFWFWYDAQVRVSTDNAFVLEHVHQISGRVYGHVSRVLVEDNQLVQAGALLIELDPADYQSRVDQDQARLALARNETSGEYAEVTRAEGALGQARAAEEQAQLDLTRGEALFTKEVIPREKLDLLRTAHRVAQAQLTQAKATLRAARARIGVAADGGHEALVAQRRAELTQSELNLSYTRIYAPVTGYVTRKSVEAGNNIQPGLPLLALVQLDQPWIVANYKESQLTHLQAGQIVEFTVDAYPQRTFSGRVESIMAGTGAAFSLLPPENATGNYVKVVQRVPVKIAIDPDSDREHLLRVGMSVVPVVHTGKSFGQILKHLNPFN